MMVALPSIQHTLHASASTLQWTVAGYTLAFALLPITGGRLGDRYGRRPSSSPAWLGSRWRRC